MTHTTTYRKLARACNGELVRVGGDVMANVYQFGELVQRAVLSRTTLLGPRADWTELWYSDYARGPSAYGMYVCLCVSPQPHACMHARTHARTHACTRAHRQIGGNGGEMQKPKP